MKIKPDWLRTEEPHAAQLHIALAIVGVIVPVVLALIGTARAIPPSEAASSALASALVLAGFLFVPASIFAPVVGAMFPMFWYATPVTVVRHSPLNRLLLVLIPTVAYGVTALTLSLVIETTWIVAAPLLVLAGIGGFFAVRLVGYSLSLLDPVLLARSIADRALHGDDVGRATRALDDLARLIRGLAERRRPIAAAQAIVLMSEVWERHAARLEPSAATLPQRVLDECEGKWGSRYADVTAAIEKCRKAIQSGAPLGSPDPSSRR